MITNLKKFVYTTTIVLPLIAEGLEVSPAVDKPFIPSIRSSSALAPSNKLTLDLKNSLTIPTQIPNFAQLTARFISPVSKNEMLSSLFKRMTLNSSSKSETQAYSLEEASQHMKSALKYLSLQVSLSPLDDERASQFKQINVFASQVNENYLQGDKFNKAQLAFLYAQAFPKLSDFKLSEALEALKPVILKDNNWNLVARAEVQYWTWKHRDYFPRLLPTSGSWDELLEAATGIPDRPDKKPSPKAQYHLGLLLDQSNNSKAQELLKNAALSYPKAAFYLKYKDLKQNPLQEDEPLRFYGELSKAGYKYPLFLIGQVLLGKDNQSEVEQGIEYLREAAACGIPQAIYLSAKLHEQQANNSTKTHEWLEKFKMAKEHYEKAAAANITGATDAIKRIDTKIKAIEKAKGYILKKLNKNEDLPLIPSNSLFSEFTRLIEVVNRGSPTAKELGTYLVQRLLEYQKTQKPNQESLKKVVVKLSDLLNDKIKNWTIDEDQNAYQCFVEMVELSKTILVENESTNLPKELRQLPEFLENARGYIFNKISNLGGSEKGIAPFSPEHPLFETICKFIADLSSYSGSVGEQGTHVVQQLLGFPKDSYQAKIILDNMLDLLASKKFNEDDKDDLDDDKGQFSKDEQQVAKLAEINESIALTVKPCRLLSLEEVRDRIKVNKKMIKDPRIGVYNHFFEEAEKDFNRQEFDNAVNGILKIFDDFVKKGIIKLTSTSDNNQSLGKELLYDDETGKEGSRSSLQRFLTRAEDAKNPIPNLFANRIIKIYEYLIKAPDDELLAAQLSSWAIAGQGHCQTRASLETERFYNTITLGGTSLESVIAKSLADLRNHLMEKIIPADQAERVHYVYYLKQAANKKLGLGERLEKDPHQEIVKPPYRNMTPKYIKNIVLNGDDKCIAKGQGYNNPEIHINWVSKLINQKEKPSIRADQILARFSLHYGAEAASRMSEYYNEDGKMSSQGVTALLCSLGYLEKELSLIGATKKNS